MAFNNYMPQQMYGQYNALAPYQQQLANMQQQYQQIQPVQQTQQEPQQNIICRPVASVEEARAIQTDFSGALMVFPDVSHGMIHTKRLDYNTGSAVFNTYRLEQPVQTAEQASASAIEYAPMSEVNALKAKIEELEAMLSEKPKPVKGAAEK